MKHLKLLYVATDQTIPGSTGGSVHVLEVARGLAKRGHEVHVMARAGDGGFAHTESEFTLHPARPFLPHRFFRWTAEKMAGQLIDRFGIDVVLERYYNFGGEGVRAAYGCGVPSVLEVNSPLMDHPGSLKSWLDRFLLFRPMKAVREDLCRKASALVTPLPAIILRSVPREKIHPVHWGANVDTFHPGVTASGSAKELPIPSGASVVVFSSSFRPWHGAELLVRAAVRVLERSPNTFFLLLGAGPMLGKVKQHAEELGVAARLHCTGAVPYEEMPHYLARAHVGVAPYQPSLHGQLQLGFYWSPLKIFEYMASGLPVVTLDIEPLREIVRPGLEGLLFPENHTERLAEAIGELVSSPERARAMGQSARRRIVSLYSWQVHCETLERVLAGVTEGAGA